jgi:hypothetical protein
MILLFAAIVCYFGTAVWRSLTKSYSTVFSYSYTVDDAAEATGFLARQETVISGQSGALVDILPGEGEKVAAGAPVAVLYRDETALQRREQLETLKMEREQLDYSLMRDGGGADSAQLDESIISAMVDLRGAVATGDFTGLEDQCLSLKSLTLRRDYCYTGGSQDISAAKQTLDGQIAALQTQVSQDTSTLRVSQPGNFSAETDGYESLLTPENILTMKPSDLDNLAAQTVTPPEDAVGRLVTGEVWYFVAAVPQETAGRLMEGYTINVRFSHDWSGDVPMRVVQVGAVQADGRATVVLSSDRNLKDTILLRNQTVDLIFGSKQGVRIPKKAVRMNEDGVTGVYALVGTQAEWKPLTILMDDGDYYLVAAADPGSSHALQAGEQIILSSKDLYDGKVMEDS